MADAPFDPFAAARANLRDTVKWLVAALAAVLAVAVGTSPLTSLGSLPDPRLWVAGGGIAVALIAYVSGISVVMNLLIGDIFVITDAVADKGLVERSAVALVQVLPVEHPTLDSFLAARKSVEDDYLAKIKSGDKAGKDAAEKALQAYTPIMRDVTSLLHLEAFREQVRRARGKLLAAMLIGTAGLIVFAWAANPPKPPPPASTIVLPAGQSVSIVLQPSK